MAARLFPSLLAVLLIPTAPAHAGGLPPTSLDAGPEGVLEPTGEHRFTALPLATKTVLTKSQTRGGRVLRASILDARWGVPVVANDGTSAGISADGTTMVLTRVAQAYPPRHSASPSSTPAPWLSAIPSSSTASGASTPSRPGGRWLYLIEQPEGVDSARTAFRAYDLRNHRMLAPGEPMSGFPITRTTGPGGRWEYTLYAGGERPFIHALDTVRRTSLSVDLPRRVTSHRRLWALRLAIRRGKVAVLDGDRIVASAARRPRRASAGGGPPWLAVGAALTGLLLAARGTGGLRLRRGAGASCGSRTGRRPPRPAPATR
jgi:hypothetical protein